MTSAEIETQSLALKTRINQMPKTISMITISDAYQPMRPGKCTLRKAKDEYVYDLRPGDVASMAYWTGVHEGKPQGERLAVEEFIVGRIVIGLAKDVMPEAWKDNHASPRSESEMWDILRAAYGEFLPNQMIVAIYAQ